jgi:hypothetical protein
MDKKLGTISQEEDIQKEWDGLEEVMKESLQANILRTKKTQGKQGVVHGKMQKCTKQG